MMTPTNSRMYRENVDWNIAQMVSPQARKLSRTTAWYRLSLRPIAWSDTPEEYRSSELMPKSCTMAKIKKSTTTQLGIVCWACNASKGFALFQSADCVLEEIKVKVAAPMTIMKISGMAVPRNIQPTIDPLLASRAT